MHKASVPRRSCRYGATTPPTALCDHAAVGTARPKWRTALALSTRATAPACDPLADIARGGSWTYDVRFVKISSGAHRPPNVGLYSERVTGIEPALSAWEIHR